MICPACQPYWKKVPHVYRDGSRIPNDEWARALALAAATHCDCGVCVHALAERRRSASVAGKASWAKLTQEQRRKRAKHAVDAREAKRANEKGAKS